MVWAVLGSQGHLRGNAHSITSRQIQLMHAAIQIPDFQGFRINTTLCEPLPLGTLIGKRTLAYTKKKLDAALFQRRKRRRRRRRRKRSKELSTFKTPVLVQMAPPTHFGPIPTRACGLAQMRNCATVPSWISSMRCIKVWTLQEFGTTKTPKPRFQKFPTIHRPPKLPKTEGRLRRSCRTAISPAMPPPMGLLQTLSRF